MKIPLKILYKPKSIVSLLVGVGLLFLLIGGGLISLSPESSKFFIDTGWLVLGIGLVGWLFFIIPAIARNLKR